MKSNEKGFSVVEILVVVVIVGLVGAVGWLVYDRQKNKANDNTVNTQAIQQEEPQEVAEKENIPDGWKKYDSNPHFSFLYPNEWESATKVSEFPISQVFKIRYIGEVKLNEKLDSWIHATTDSGATVGSKADVIQEESNSAVKVWRFGFGDAGYASLIPTFVADGEIYQITTGSSCPERTADCMAGEEYKQAYDKLVASIKLK